MVNDYIVNFLTDLKGDTTTVAGLVFVSFLVIYFFAVIKPPLDSRVRVNRIVRRRMEYAKADEKYQRMMIKQQLGKSATQAKIDATYKQNKQNQANKKSYNKGGGYIKDKGYYAYLRHNSNKTNSIQLKKHTSFSNFKKPSKTHGRS